MLCSLSVRNVLLIRHLEIEFGDGLNVLTGETGAGKSILLDSLGFVLGSPLQPNMHASAADQCEVAAIFDISANRAAQAVLDEIGVPAEDELHLRRNLQPSGRTTSFINDRRCSLSALGRLAEVLVEIHGQVDDRGLLNPGRHRQLLDRFAGHGHALGEVRDGWAGWQKTLTRYRQAREKQEAATREREFCEHAIAELDEMDLQEGEDEELDRRRTALKLFQRYEESIVRAEQAIGNSGAEGHVAEAISWLERAAPMNEPRLHGAVEALDRAIAELADARHGLELVRSGNDRDPGEIERIEERLFAIRALARKHAVRPDQLQEVARKLAASMTDLAQLDQDVGMLDRLHDEQARSYREAASRLSEGRHRASARLDRAMKKETGPLKLKHAVFRTVVTEDQQGPDGMDRVAFTVSTDPSHPPGPIGSIASGGELSRFMLALKVCLMAGTDSICAIFDEIDRGIGGPTANAVGRRLRSLSDQSQVLVVTHSPQVAAMGHHHWRIEKRKAAGGMRTTAARLDEAARTDEIARMLSGAAITDEARAAAASLLQAV